MVSNDKTALRWVNAPKRSRELYAFFKYMLVKHPERYCNPQLECIGDSYGERLLINHKDTFYEGGITIYYYNPWFVWEKVIVT